ncbi:MAG TPA: tetratricopeptide repeat protein [Solirubrobacteraceae bacterium]
MEAAFGRTPSPDTLGYQAAVDAGMAASEAGVTALALCYFERAVQLRSTPYALSHQGRCLRDLGRLEEALAAYRSAMKAIGGKDYARVGLATVLCDLGQHAEALPLAKVAAEGEPDSPAALRVLARCLDEHAEALKESPADRACLPFIRDFARDLRAKARALDPVSQGERKRVRRETAFPLHSVEVERYEQRRPPEPATDPVRHTPPTGEVPEVAEPARLISLPASVCRRTPEQIADDLKVADRLLGEGKTLPEVLAAVSISRRTLQRWRARYGGHRVEDVKRMRELTLENQRLRRAVREQQRENAGLRRLTTANGELGDGDPA